MNIHPRYNNLELFLYVAILLTVRPAFWSARKFRLRPRWHRWRKARRAV